jgi:hypothetical protein
MTVERNATSPVPYGSPQAFGAAITARLKAIVGTSGYSESQLRRQFAYDRLLARLVSDDSEEWILKGGVALIARLSVARHTADVDIVNSSDSIDAALPTLGRVLSRDLGDFFTFRLDPPRSLVQGVSGVRIATEAWLGPRRFERFGVDLVTGAIITGTTETAEPMPAIDLPGLMRPPYRLYPLADTIADKVLAIMEIHNGRPSTRFRDLVDLVLIARSRPVRAEDLTRAIASERLRRGLVEVHELRAPDVGMWRGGYAKAASPMPGLPEQTLVEALAVAKRLVDPVLAGTVPGMRWDPVGLCWRPESSGRNRALVPHPRHG